VRNFAFLSTATKRVIHPLGHGRRHTEDSWRLRIASSAVSLAAPFYGTIKLQSPSASGAYLIVSRSASAGGNEEGVVGLVGYCKAFVTVSLGHCEATTDETRLCCLADPICCVVSIHSSALAS